MISLEYFEDDADEARRILEAMSRRASERIGRPCTFAFASSLDAAAVQRLLELELDAFGAPGVAFTRRDLDEIMADPEALFITLEIDGRMEGCLFGYWEWPDQITVPGSDFFLDSAMVSSKYRGKGIGRVAITGVLLLVDLLECRRIGIAAWQQGPRGRGLVRFYRRFGFARVVGAGGPHAKMVLGRDEARLARWRLELEMPPDGWGPPKPGRLWPRVDERLLAGRFYAAMGLGETLYLVAPFEFAYLYLTLNRPDWAVLVMVAGTVAALIAGMPAGVLADRWSRKLVVLLGGALAGVGLAAVPLAVTARGTRQLVSTCAAFAVIGIGQTLMAGAAEAWVVDNLHVAGRRDLIQTFYGRVRSVAAAGGAIAAAAALALLLGTVVDRGLLNLLWFIGGAGFVVSVLLAATIPERRPAGDESATGARPRVTDALRVLVGRRFLLMISLAIVLAASSGTASDEAFTVALITRGFDARLFAPLSIVDSLLGIAGPLIGIALARRLGVTRFLALFLVLEATCVTVLFASGGVATLLGLYVLLDLLDDAWDPVALARLQALTPSAHRATISAIVYEFGSIAELAALGVFALMLGRHRAALEQATPDLLEAFSGQAHAVPVLPAVWLGLTVPELAIVIFIGFGLLSVPFVLASGNPVPPAPRRPRSASAPE